MTVSALEPSLTSLDALVGVDALCLFVAQDDRPLHGAAGFADWRLCGALSRVLEGGFFAGQRGEQLLMPTSGQLPPLKLFAVGAGPSNTLTAEALGALLDAGGAMLKKAAVRSVAVALPKAPNVDEAVKAQLIKSRFAGAFGGSVQVLAERALKALL